MESVDLSQCSLLKVIGKYSFAGCSKLSALSLPEGITTINDRAFSYTGLLSVTIPSSLTTFEDAVFESCSSLSSVIFQPNCQVRILTSFLFLGTSITSIVIPPNVATIIGSLFQWNYKVTSISIDQDNENFITDGKGIFSRNGEIMQYFASGITGSYTVPSGVIYTAYACFTSSSLSQVIFQTGFKFLSDYTFYDSKVINSISLPDTVTFIGEGCFSGAMSLTQITLPPLITTISAYCFASSGLTSIRIPDQITEIKNLAFAYCPDLYDVIMPKYLSSIGGNIIADSPHARLVFQKDSLIHINEEGLLLDSANTTVSQYFGKPDKPEIVFPSTVKTIKTRCFIGLNQLVSIVCNGASMLEYIEESAFNGCTSLTKIFDFPNIISIGKWAFYQSGISQPIVFGNSLTFLGESCFS